MKLFKFLGLFFIFYFGYFFVQGVGDIVSTFSFDNEYLQYTWLALLFVIVFYYGIWPLIAYFSMPSIKELEAYLSSNKYERKIIRYIEKKYHYSFQTKEGLVHFLENQVESFDGIIKSYASQVTVTVMISPNAVIDGLSILLANTKMIYELSKKFGFRYSFKTLLSLYFSVFTMASISGLVETFDETLEAILEELADEFSELIAEETGKNIPFLNVAVSALSPIIQAAGNFAFIYYSGFSFKYDLLNLIDQEGLSKKDIKKKARKRARMMRYNYIKEMSSKVMVGAGKKIMALRPLK